MGIKNLKKNLISVDVLEIISTELIPESAILMIDYYCYFHSSRYQIKFEEDINLLPEMIKKSIMDNSDESNPLIIFIDQGVIMRKQMERNKRQSAIDDPVSASIMKQKESLTKQSLQLLFPEYNLDNITISFNLNSNKKSKFDKIMRRIKKYNCCIIYVNNFDAEFCMAIIANEFTQLKLEKEIVLGSNDQDILALTIINCPNVYTFSGNYKNRTMIRCKQDCITYSQLIVFITLLINSSDYFEGIKSVDANEKTIPIIAGNVSLFNLDDQILSEEIHNDNIELINIILKRVKSNSINKYYENNDYTKEFINYVNNCCRWLLLQVNFYKN